MIYKIIPYKKDFMIIEKNFNNSILCSYKNYRMVYYFYSITECIKDFKKYLNSNKIEVKL